MEDNNLNNELLQPGTSIKPLLDLEDVKNIVFEHYGLKVVSVVELNGYDDKNYHVFTEKNETEGDNGECPDGYVFKVINSLDSKKPELFDAQNLLLVYVGNHGIKCPKPLPTREGHFCKKIQLKSGEHIIRLLEFISGTIFHKISCSPDIFYQIGELAAKLDTALKGFDHPAYEHHETIWMMHSIPKLRKFLFSVTNEERRSMCEKIIEEFEQRVIPRIKDFDKGMIHGDINEQNILVEKKNGKYQIKAILDFGDSHKTCYLFELAVMMTYLILQSKDLNMGSYILAGYLSHKKISEEEYKLLKICICARLCISLVMGAYSHSLEPENSYLLVTAIYGWKLLEQLRNEPEEELLRKWKKIAEEFTLNL